MPSRTQDLAAQLESKDGLVRQAARERLVSLGQSVAADLCDLLKHPSAQVRWEAAMALKEIADTDCIPDLMGALFDADEGVRWVAAEALGGLGRPGMRTLLYHLIRDASSRKIRSAFRVASTCLLDAELRKVLEPLRETLVREAPAVVVILAAELARSKLDN